MRAGVTHGRPSVDRSEIEKLAHLARLEIRPEEIDEVATRISNVLALVDQLQALDTGNVAPMAHPLDAVQRLRADEVSEPNRRDEFLAIAPATENGLYLVPKVID
ncbi:Asp-tRNA(Asn)/Glu-tRNA(Gln) amidotransferase subunit GatC [Saccharophagus sp. K07]|uniref:Asp-tRNA(Asn)/Glu-tRNA(Gln) amidotransferase subunit GatC n=1 Tax=Saccharophagus sp. K07 TaxID=2283636 RepID=UPI001CA326E8|nr:Asp-tRNA(Asn)/Glu-tRNA(Gln) amidotransferase subunit GatC [Saccharophagus sp. K07]